MSLEVRIVSLGALPTHPLWVDNSGAIDPTGPRAGHSTCSLVRSGKRVIIVDPGLPDAIITARLSERAGLRPSEVTHVFLTSFKADVRRGLLAFEHAPWWINLAEREGMGIPLVHSAQEALRAGDDDLADTLQRDIALLKRCEAAPDRVADRVDLFPLPGVTPGCCGLLISGPASGPGPGTTLITGDAVPTIEHFERGLVLDSSTDINQARESFKEAIEIADVIIPGRGGMIVNQTRRLL
ncbi:MAG: MBL fold metallo-hydrolase [Phycisphaerales bacterium]|nr:MBL fold metallo-hydrolase [Phycisphaerales bacterium]